MSLEDVNLQLPDCFSGVVRLFPLPNLVLFPGVIQPLHIFEARYRQLLEDALLNDELIAMALMKPGWQDGLRDEPEVFQTVCIGRVITHTRTEDGRYNLLLNGITRAKIIREISSDRQYRMAEVNVVNDIIDATNPDLEQLQIDLKRNFAELCRNDLSIDAESIENLLTQEMPLGKLVDLISFSLDTSPLDKQLVLDCHDLEFRTRLVINQIERQSIQTGGCELQEIASTGFPPNFSLN